MGCLTEWQINLLTTFVKVNNLCFVLPHREEANLVQTVIISSISNTTKLKDCCKENKWNPGRAHSLFERAHLLTPTCPRDGRIARNPAE